jgi:hypothetical protein
MHIKVILDAKTLEGVNGSYFLGESVSFVRERWELPACPSSAMIIKKIEPMTEIKDLRLTIDSPNDFYNLNNLYCFGNTSQMFAKIKTIELYNYGTSRP